MTTLLVKHPLSISQLGQLSLPSLWGWKNALVAGANGGTCGVMCGLSPT